MPVNSHFLMALTRMNGVDVQNFLMVFSSTDYQHRWTQIFGGLKTHFGIGCSEFGVLSSAFSALTPSFPFVRM